MKLGSYRAAVAALSLTVLGAPATAQSVRAGIEAWQKGEFENAVAAWTPLAQAGDADAAFNLGQAYRLGKGVALNLAAAQQWYERAARKGHVDAATSLGVLLFQNGDRIAAMRWLRQAADGGEVRALLLYGTALYNGDGVKRDPVRAYAYVSRAAAMGLAPARATLADMDAAMPLDQRQRGVALAKTMVGPRAAPVKTAAKPMTKPAAPAAKQGTASPPTSGWRIQLGAFSKRSSAEALFRQLSGSLGGAGAFYVPAGAVTRLHVGPFATKAAAGAACARLSARGQPCFLVPPR